MRSPKNLHFLYILISVIILLIINTDCSDFQVVRPAGKLPAAVEVIYVIRDAAPSRPNTDMSYDEELSFISYLNEYAQSRKMRLRFEYGGCLDSTSESNWPRASLYITKFNTECVMSGDSHSTTVERVRTKKESYDIITDYSISGSDVINNTVITMEGKILGGGLQQSIIHYKVTDEYFLARFGDDLHEIKLDAIKVIAEHLIDELDASSR